jgi:ABC-type sugar transport system substrate-binding protein
VPGKHRNAGLRLLSVTSIAATVVLGSPAISNAAIGPVARDGAVRSISPQIAKPSKALCKRASYKIGYDVFSGSQPFASLVTSGLVDAAKKIGCATVAKTIDNLDGPVAIGNLKTLLNEGIQGFVDFQVLAAYQPSIAKLLSSAKIPGVAIVGANLPGSPDVGADNYTSAYDDGVYLAQQSKVRFPGQVPYVLGGAEPTSGALIMERYNGAVAGEKSVFHSLPSSHIIEVQNDGTAPTAYNNTLSALSTVPKGSLVLLTGVNDEVTGGMAKAAATRGVTKYLVNSYGGDPYGFSQVCTNSHYVGAWYLEPTLWGQDALTAIMDEMNGVKVPGTIGVVGEEVTKAMSIVGCK